MEEEIWKDIKGYEGYYQVSNLGRVKSLQRRVHCADKLGGIRLKRENLLKPYYYKTGYCCVVLAKDKNKERRLVHRLVAEAFIPNPNNYPQINHKDECKGNNCASNLEWCTAKYNSNYGNRTERSSIAKYKPVSMFDKEGNLICHFESMKEAQLFLDMKLEPKYLREHHSARGFQFRYKGESCGKYTENRGKYKRG